MSPTTRKYPIGIQTFSKLRENGCVYVDKTDQIYELTHNGTYVFLSRPRRFGKSLLVSTLEAYFQGRRELFEGLAIEGMEAEWKPYPVLHFDMSTAKHAEEKSLNEELSLKLTRYEAIYGAGNDEKNLNSRFEGLIMRAYEQTGKQVVVLIDEYDAPLLDVVHEEEELPKLRQVMRNFYSPLKACDPYLRFVFLTGITKFTQLSIFSELNNIKNISMLPQYATLCGISKEELLTQLAPDITLLAERMGKTREETTRDLIHHYDGYHFIWPSPDIFNPFSLMNAFFDGRIDSYWFGSGTPTSLIEMLRKFGVQPTQIGQRRCAVEEFDAPTERMTDITPLLYQSGYITIKGCSPITGQYLLDIPNQEVRLGLTKSLIENYVAQPGKVRNLVAEMYEHLYFGRLEESLQLMQTVLGTLPYCSGTHTEGHYQQLLALIFTLMGCYVDVEVRTSSGRLDMAMLLHDTIYLFEMKLHDTAAAALAQIEQKNYAERFALSSLPVVKVGLSFDPEQRTLKEWRILR